MRKVSSGSYEISSRFRMRSAHCEGFRPAGELPVPYSVSLPCVLICPRCVFFWIWLPDSTLRPVPSIYNLKPSRIHQDCSVWPSVHSPGPPQFRATVSFIFIAALCFWFSTRQPCLPPPAPLPQLRLWRCSELRLSELASCILAPG